MTAEKLAWRKDGPSGMFHKARMAHEAFRGFSLGKDIEHRWIMDT